MKMPPCVRPAAHFYHSALWLSEEGVIGGIGVGLQMTAIAFQKTLPARLALAWRYSHTLPRHAPDRRHTARCDPCAPEAVSGPAPSLACRRFPPLWKPVQTASAADITAPAAARIARSIRTRSDPTALHHGAQTFSLAGVTADDPRTSLRSPAPAGWLPLCSSRSAVRAWWLSSPCMRTHR